MENLGAIIALLVFLACKEYWDQCAEAALTQKINKLINKELNKREKEVLDNMELEKKKKLKIEENKNIKKKKIEQKVAEELEKIETSISVNALVRFVKFSFKFLLFSLLSYYSLDFFYFLISCLLVL